ncbi:hypothetical protein BMS3Bbin09_01104 [bacterium BMS3Bbin09]|nr:hypothetical protein BMS3Bbin09_01104 [bacterium BMS3Bbin09]
MRFFGLCQKWQIEGGVEWVGQKQNADFKLAHTIVSLGIINYAPTIYAFLNLLNPNTLAPTRKRVELIGSGTTVLAVDAIFPGCTAIA